MMLESAGSVSVSLLGGFAATVDGVPVPATAWRLKKARELVKLLALAPGHRLHREQAMDLLWRDRAPAAAANNLHQAVYVARRALNGSAIVVWEESLHLANLLPCMRKGFGRTPGPLKRKRSGLDLYDLKSAVLAGDVNAQEISADFDHPLLQRTCCHTNFVQDPFVCAHFDEIDSRLQDTSHLCAIQTQISQRHIFLSSAERCQRRLFELIVSRLNNRLLKVIK
jgi:hypothetical protein